MKTEMKELIVQVIAQGFGIVVSLYTLLFIWTKAQIRKYVLGLNDDERQFLQAPDTLQDKRWGTHAYAKLKGVKLHYVTKGDSQKHLVILLHGFPEFWYSWRHQLEDLGRDYWVVAPDMRGFGDSDKPEGTSNYHLTHLVEDIRQLINVLGRDKATVVAHDWGGAVGWFLAILHPSMVEKLIILNSPHPQAFFKFAEKNIRQVIKSWYMFAFQAPFLPEIFLKMCLPWKFETAFRKTDSGKKNITDADIKAFQYMFTKPGAITPAVNYYRANLLKQMPYEQNKELTMPTTVIWGIHDGYLCFEMACLSGDYAKDFTLKGISDGSHWVNQDSPQLVNKYIREFLSRDK